MGACVIFHNMIAKDERDNYELAFDYDVVKSTAPEPIVNPDDHLAMRRTLKIKRSL